MRVGIRTLQAVPLIGILHLVPIVDFSASTHTAKEQTRFRPDSWNAEEFPGRRLSSVTSTLWCDTAIHSLTLSVLMNWKKHTKQASLAQAISVSWEDHDIYFFVSADQGNFITHNSDSKHCRFFLTI